MSNCFDCKLATCRSRVVDNTVIPNCDICFVAEAPGAEEDVSGVPLIGRAGNVFNCSLREVGIDRSRCSVCNTVRCRPPSNRPPEKDEIKACYNYLENDIKLSGAKIIMPMGATALQRIMGKKQIKITKVCGSILESTLYPGVRIIPAIHPAAILRDPSYQGKLTGPLNIAMSILNGTFGASAATGVYEQIVCRQQAFEVLAQIADAPAFAFDIEFTSPLPPAPVQTGKKGKVKKKKLPKKLRPMNGHIICCSFSIRQGHGWWILWEDLVAWIGDYFKSLMAGSKLKVVHNSMCELKFMYYFGYPMALPIFDTMIGEYLTDESEKAYASDVTSLKKLALKYTDMGDYAADISKLIEDGKIETIPVEKLGVYCAKDSDATLRLKELQVPKITGEGMDTLYHGLLMPSAELLSRVELTGAHIDQGEIGKIRVDLDSKIAICKTAMEEWLQGTNPNSGIQLAKVLQARGVRLFKLTKKSEIAQRMGSTKPKRYKLDEEVLTELAAEHPWIKSMLDYRKHFKLRSTYTDNFLAMLDADGRLRTNYSLSFTDTGRLASRGPNLQNIPKDSSIRNMFAAPDGFNIVCADASQAELRWGAIHTGDPTLIRLLNDSTVDIHTQVAAEVFGVPIDQVTPEMRNKIKPVNFGIFYGAMAPTIALEAGISLAEADALIKTWFERFHFVLEWKERTIANARECGYVESKFGRKRRLPGLTSQDNYVRMEAERQCINAPIQADASDMTLMGSLKVDALMKETKFLSNPFYKYETAEFMTVHDSIMYYIEQGREMEFITLTKPVLEDFPIKIVPMTFDFEIGKRWGELEKIGKKKEVKMVAA